MIGAMEGERKAHVTTDLEKRVEARAVLTWLFKLKILVEAAVGGECEGAWSQGLIQSLDARWRQGLLLALGR